MLFVAHSWLNEKEGRETRDLVVVCRPQLVKGKEGSEGARSSCGCWRQARQLGDCEMRLMTVSSPRELINLNEASREMSKGREGIVSTEEMEEEDEDRKRVCREEYGSFFPSLRSVRRRLSNVAFAWRENRQ